jgi:hypothetical protein
MDCIVVANTVTVYRCHDGLHLHIRRQVGAQRNHILKTRLVLGVIESTALVLLIAIKRIDSLPQPPKSVQLAIVTPSVEVD